MSREGDYWRGVKGHGYEGNWAHNARSSTSQGKCAGCGRHLRYNDHHPTKSGYCKWGECA